MINIVEEFNRAKLIKVIISRALIEAGNKSGFLIAYHENFNIPKFSAWTYEKLVVKRSILIECLDHNVLKVVEKGDYTDEEINRVLDAMSDVFGGQ